MFNENVFVIKSFESAEELKNYIFTKWEHSDNITFNGMPFSTLSALLAYDHKNNTLEIYDYHDKELEHPISIFNIEIINTIDGVIILKKWL